MFFKILVIFLFVFSCNLLDPNNQEAETNFQMTKGTAYIALQALDQVGIVDLSTKEIDYVDINFVSTNCFLDYSNKTDCDMSVSCYWHESMNHCMEHSDNCLSLDLSDCLSDSNCNWYEDMGHCMKVGGMMDMGENTPHFIEIDTLNGYWFVTAITSGYVGRYSLDSNELIDKIMIGDSPALMVLNPNNKKLYVSRMMPMAGMMTGAVSTVIQEIDYNDSNKMNLSSEYIIGSPAPHGLAINSDGSEVYTVSNTADWLWKINTINNNITGVVMDSTILNASDVATQRLKPLQIISVKDSLLFITCSGGIYYNSYNGTSDTLAGQLQMWNSKTLKLINTFEFDWYSKPWHLVASKKTNEIYISLAGDINYDLSSGLVSIKYNSEEGLEKNVNWSSYSQDFNTLHGIDINYDEEVVLISGRRDDHLHLFNVSSEQYLYSIDLPTSSLAAGIKVK